MDVLEEMIEIWDDIRYKEFYELKELDIQDLEDFVDKWYYFQKVNKESK